MGLMAGEGQRDGIEGAASGNASVWAGLGSVPEQVPQPALGCTGCRIAGTPYGRPRLELSRVACTILPLVLAGRFAANKTGKFFGGCPGRMMGRCA